MTFSVTVMDTVGTAISHEADYTSRVPVDRLPVERLWDVLNIYIYLSGEGSICKSMLELYNIS